MFNKILIALGLRKKSTPARRESDKLVDDGLGNMVVSSAYRTKPMNDLIKTKPHRGFTHIKTPDGMKRKSGQVPPAPMPTKAPPQRFASQPGQDLRRSTIDQNNYVNMLMTTYYPPCESFASCSSSDTSSSSSDSGSSSSCSSD